MTNEEQLKELEATIAKAQQLVKELQDDPIYVDGYKVTFLSDGVKIATRTFTKDYLKELQYFTSILSFEYDKFKLHSTDIDKILARLEKK